MAKKQLTIEEKLQAALVPAEEQPYKVPENWCWVRLGGVCSFVGGGTPSKKNPEFWNGDISWASVKDIKGDYLFETIDSITDIGCQNSATNICEENDVLLVTRIEPGKTIISKIRTAINQDIKIVKSELSAEYLHYFFKTFQYEFIQRASGSTVKGITISSVQNVQFPLSPQKEQSRIVARIESLFAKLDEAKEKIQEVLDGADLRRAAILHQAFTGKLTEKWRRENGVSDENWEYKSIKEIAVPRAGVAFDSKKFSTKGYQVIRMGNLYNGELDLSRNPVYYPREFLDNKILERALIHNDDILITLTGTKYKRDYGYAVKMVNPEKLLVNQRILCLTAIKEYVLSDYLNYYLQTKLFRDVFFSNETGGVNQGNVSSKFVESIVIKVPLVDEQQEIVHLLDNLLSREQSTVTACEEALTTIDTLKKSILARAFRGELGTNDPTDPSAQELLREILSA